MTPDRAGVPMGEMRNHGIALDAAVGERLDGFDCVIWAECRSSNTSDLGPAAAGVEIRGSGIVPIDDVQSTDVPAI